MTFKWSNYTSVKNSNNGKDPKQHEGGQKLKYVLVKYIFQIII